MVKLNEIDVNGMKHPIHADPDTPLLFVLRDEIGLTGRKNGCGEGQSGACTELIADRLGARARCRRRCSRAGSHGIMESRFLLTNSQYHSERRLLELR